MSRDFAAESLAYDPIHGYIPFVSRVGLKGDEVPEQEIIDHPWVQRMRHIHQLQTAWWVFPSAEHRRFQHILGAMH
ncbi:MAG TPA: metal-dependent phosphohydrolase, partial [Planctomicrobium sp.]|nr:metal-dependent phosphohydrolase [Planctomicrobium sp.]